MRLKCERDFFNWSLAVLEMHNSFENTVGHHFFLHSFSYQSALKLFWFFDAEEISRKVVCIFRVPVKKQQFYVLVTFTTKLKHWWPPSWIESHEALKLDLLVVQDRVEAHYPLLQAWNFWQYWLRRGRESFSPQFPPSIFVFLKVTILKKVVQK